MPFSSLVNGPSKGNEGTYVLPLPQIMPLCALPIQAFAFARTPYAAIPGVRLELRLNIAWQRRTLYRQLGQENRVVGFDKLVKKGSFWAMAHILACTNARTGFPANLRILEIRKIKSFPYTPVSHPFVERLIGTIRWEYLDRV